MMRFIAFVSALAMVPAMAQAGNYGAAGCGLGSVVMGKDGNQILAFTTNATFGSQLFGLTTGTLNCGSDGVVMKEKATQHFAEVNMSNLQRQAAAGGGEHLAAFAALNGCSSAQTQQVFSTMQSQHAQVFNAGTAQVVPRFRTAVAGICSL
jgi:hypothetical protein